MSYEEVRKQTFQETTSSISLGTKAAVTWFRFTLRNSSLKARALFCTCPVLITPVQSIFFKSVLKT
ncbi:MAG: hypothetical protein V7760_09625 [Marinobacter sp.]